MIAELTWHPQAREDLLEIYLTIGFDNPDAAKRFYTTIEVRAATLARHPRLGPRRPDIRASVRILVEGPYLFSMRLNLTPTMGRSLQSR